MEREELKELVRELLREIRLEEKKKFVPSKRPPKPYNLFATHLNHKFMELLKEHNPAAKIHNTMTENHAIQSWPFHFEKMIKRDIRSPELIEKVMDFTFKDSFWKNVVTSADNFRRNFEKIYGSMMNSEEHDFDNRESEIEDALKELQVRED